MLKIIYAKHKRSHLQFWSNWIFFYVINIFLLAYTAEQTTSDEHLVTIFKPIPTKLPDERTLNLQRVEKTSVYFEGMRDNVNSHAVSRNRYFPSYSNNNQEFEVLSNHAPPELNVSTSRNKSSSPAYVETYDVPPWPTKELIKNNKNHSSEQPTQIPNEITSVATNKLESEALDGTTLRLRFDDTSAASTMTSQSIGSETTLLPATDRQTYKATTSPFVIMNNHKPRPSFLEKDKIYTWIMDIDETTKLDSTTTSMQTSIKLPVTTTKPEIQTKSTTINKRKGTSVPKAATTSRSITTRKTYRPYEYTAYSGTTETSIPLTTRRPTQHGVGVYSFRPLATFMSHAVITIATFVQRSFLNSLLILIPSAFLGMLLL